MTLTRRSALIGALSAPLAACSAGGGSSTFSSHPTSASRSTSHTPQGEPTMTTASATTVPTFTPVRFTSLAPGAQLTHVPSNTEHAQVAITLDDGVRSDVVAGYAALAAHTGIRLTMFANGRYDSWRENKTALMPLIESGQLVIGNHTFSHPNLTLRDNAEISQEITSNEKHFKNLFGIDLKPFFRPPYGYINTRVAHVLADHGYDHPVMWYGTFGDDQDISTRAIEANMRQWLTPGKLVIGHLNHRGTLGSYDTLHELIVTRKLTTVTLHDIMPVK